MMQHNIEESQLSLYEGDQSKLYSGVFNPHRNEDVRSEGSKKQIRRIWTITLYLAIITSLEIGMGLWNYAGSPLSHPVSVTLFVIMTILKAYLIVDVFMHLGDELRTFVIAVLIALVFFVWFIIALLAEGDFWLRINQTQGNAIKTEQVSPKK